MAGRLEIGGGDVNIGLAALQEIRRRQAESQAGGGQPAHYRTAAEFYAPLRAQKSGIAQARIQADLERMRLAEQARQFDAKAGFTAQQAALERQDQAAARQLAEDRFQQQQAMEQQRIDAEQGYRDDQLGLSYLGLQNQKEEREATRREKQDKETKADAEKNAAKLRARAATLAAQLASPDVDPDTRANLVNEYREVYDTLAFMGEPIPTASPDVLQQMGDSAYKRKKEDADLTKQLKVDAANEAKRKAEEAERLRQEALKNQQVLSVDKQHLSKGTTGISTDELASFYEKDAGMSPEEAQAKAASKLPVNQYLQEMDQQVDGLNPNQKLAKYTEELNALEGRLWVEVGKDADGGRIMAERTYPAIDRRSGKPVIDPATDKPVERTYKEMLKAEGVNVAELRKRLQERIKAAEADVSPEYNAGMTDEQFAATSAEGARAAAIAAAQPGGLRRGLMAAATFFPTLSPLATLEGQTEMAGRPLVEAGAAATGEAERARVMALLEELRRRGQPVPQLEPQGNFVGTQSGPMQPLY